MRSSGTVLCLGSATAFGAMAVIGKLAYDEGATVGTLLAIRFALAAALFWALVLADGTAAEIRALDGRDIGAAVALGACAYAAQAGCYFAALERIDASLLSLLVYTSPAIVAVTAIALGRERFDVRRLAALALAPAGSCSSWPAPETGALDPLGAALAVATALIYSTYILVGERITARVRPHLLAALVCTGAAVTLTARLGAARAVASRRAVGRRLGVAGLHRRRVDRRRARPVLRGPPARRADDGVDPLDGRAAGDGAAGLPRLRRAADRRAAARRCPRARRRARTAGGRS